jgi:hypothetical protein
MRGRNSERGRGVHRHLSDSGGERRPHVLIAFAGSAEKYLRAGPAGVQCRPQFPGRADLRADAVAATFGLARLPVVAVATLAAAAGLCGPLLTGGLSSQLAALAPPDEHAQRRAQGLDSLSYGVRGTVGPAAVASLAALTGARMSMVILAAAAVAAAVLIRTLPASGNTVPPDRVLPVRKALQLIVTTGPLRRVMYTTVVAAVPGGAIAVIPSRSAPNSTLTRVRPVCSSPRSASATSPARWR